MNTDLNAQPFEVPMDAWTISANNPVCLERHKYSNLFSEFDPPKTEINEMADSIERKGLLSPITLHQGKVLDGWNRIQACTIAGVPPVFEELAPGLDPWEFVKAKNLLRRHLSPSERFSVLAAKLELDRQEEAPVGGCSILNTPSVREIAQELHVSTGTAHKVAKILRANDPELTAAVAANSVPLGDAAEIAGLPEPERRKAVIVARAMAARPRTARAQMPTEVVALQAILTERIAEINELAKAHALELGTNSVLRAEAAALNATIARRDERIRELTQALVEALEEIERLKAKALPSALENNEQAAVKDPEPEETKEALAAIEETLGDVAEKGDVAEAGVEAVEAPAAVDETPGDVAGMDEVLQEEISGEFAVLDVAVQDHDTAEALLSPPSPLAIHTQGLLQVCPRSRKNRDQPDKRTKEFDLYGEAEDILEIEGRLQRGAEASAIDREAYFAYLKHHGLAAATAMPLAVIQEQTPIVGMPPEAEAARANISRLDAEIIEIQFTRDHFDALVEDQIRTVRAPIWYAHAAERAELCAFNRGEILPPPAKKPPFIYLHQEPRN